MHYTEHVYSQQYVAKTAFHECSFLLLGSALSTNFSRFQLTTIIAYKSSSENIWPKIRFDTNLHDQDYLLKIVYSALYMSLDTSAAH